MLIGAMVVLAGCTYDAAIRQLSLAEQSEFYTYKQVMTTAQERTNLTKATAAERTAYLSEIGLAQRFQTLDPLDREAVQNGYPRVGMSAEALRFVWGDPYALLAMPAITPTGTIWVRPSGAATLATVPGVLGIASMSISSLARSWGGSMRPPVPKRLMVINSSASLVAHHLLLQ
jgi:hypothetical protein